MSISIATLLGVEQVRHQVKHNFTHAVSGVDLIIGARTGNLHLLLYSVFNIGTPTNNMRWQTYQAIVNDPQVAWAIPISLGDSHRGYRVVGTSQSYFESFSYGNQQALTFAQGKSFNDLFDVVLGSEVAKTLAYELNDSIVLAHGMATTSFSMHQQHPFNITGILAPTGTPVDRAVYVSLQAIEAIHMDWRQGVRPSNTTDSQHLKDLKALEPKQITTVMVGLRSKLTTFRTQRALNEYRQEPLTAILPGVALSELWQMVSVLENTLLFVSALVYLAACLGVSAMLLSSIRERHNEMQLLRAIGVPPILLFWLIECEALMIILLSSIIGASLIALLIWLLGDVLLLQFGVYITIDLFSRSTLIGLVALLVTSLCLAAIPSFTAYRQACTLR